MKTSLNRKKVPFNVLARWYGTWCYFWCTPIHINNTTTVGIVNNSIKPQLSQAMKMRYFWLLDGEAQCLLWFYYQPGQENLGDYPSKHHSANIHQHVWPCSYVHMDNSLSFLPRAANPSSWQGCVETLADPYKGRVPLPSVPNYQDILSRHLSRMDTTTPNRQEPFLNGKHMKHSFPTIVTE